ncbi:hypothetical protein ACFE04_021292 [Oxalis oulophora]
MSDLAVCLRLSQRLTSCRSLSNGLIVCLLFLLLLQRIRTHEHLYNISELNELPDDVKNRLTVAGFGHFHSIQSKPKQIPALNKFLQNHYDATDKCFEFGKNKFFYGLRDIYLFFGLSIDGRPIHCESLSNDEARVFVREFIGGDTIKYCPRRGVPIRGSVIAPGPNENYVHKKHLPLVQNLDEVHLYSWGAAYLGSVHEALSSKHNKLCCSLFPIYVSLFLHFLGLKKFFKARQRVQMKFPLCVKWFEVMSLKPSSTTILNRSLKHNYLGRIVDSIENGRVVWDPTSNMKSPLREECLQMGQAIVPLICHEYIHYHMPFVSPSQFNLHADEINVEAYQSDHMDGNTLNVSHSTDQSDHVDGNTQNVSHSTGRSDYQEQDGTGEEPHGSGVQQNEEHVRGGNEKRKTNNDQSDHMDGNTQNVSHSTGPSDYEEQDGIGEEPHGSGVQQNEEHVRGGNKKRKTKKGRVTEPIRKLTRIVKRPVPYEVIQNDHGPLLSTPASMLFPGRHRTESNEFDKNPYKSLGPWGLWTENPITISCLKYSVPISLRYENSIDYPDSESSGAVTMLEKDENDEPPPQQQQEVSPSPPQQQHEIASTMSPQLSSGSNHASTSSGGNSVDDRNERGDTGTIHASMSAGRTPVDDGTEGGNTEPPPQQQQETTSIMSPQLSSGANHASMSAGGKSVDDGNEEGDTEIQLPIVLPSIGLSRRSRRMLISNEFHFHPSFLQTETPEHLQ